MLDGPFQKDQCVSLWHDFSQKGYVVRIVVVKLPNQQPWMYVMAALVSQIQLKYEPAQWLLFSCIVFWHFLATLFKRTPVMVVVTVTVAGICSCNSCFLGAG